MRAVSIVMGCLAFGAVTAVTAQTTSTPAATPAAAKAPAPASAPAAAAAPAATAEPAAAPAADTTRVDQKMIARGYKPAMSGNERVYCRKEEQIGSHLPAKKVCLTAQQAEQAEHDAREITEQMQRTNKPVGGR